MFFWSRYLEGALFTSIIIYIKTILRGRNSGMRIKSQENISKEQ